MTTSALRALACAAGLVGASGCGPAPPTPASNAAPVEALNDLRAIGYADWDPSADTDRHGVTRNLPEKVQPGVQLFTDEASTVHALALDGSPVHQWQVPGRSQCEHVEWLGGGRIAVLSVDEGVSVLDRAGALVWSHDAAVHHDLAPLPDGALLVPVHAEREYHGRRVRFDSIARIDTEGLSIEWSSFDHRAELSALHPPTPLDRPATPTTTGPADRGQVYDYYHLNSVEVLPPSELGVVDPRFRAGNLLVCLRNVNLVLVLDHERGTVLWHWGSGELDAPHMPSLTPAGTVLIFDNGRRRGWSRLLEVDPRTDTITWEWRADPPESFYSELRGSAQRLENGNTLVCESERGRAFELTPRGEIVWEYWNAPEEGRRRRIYRMTRIGPEDAPSLVR